MNSMPHSPGPAEPNQPHFPQNMDFSLLSRDFADIIVWDGLQEVLLVMTKIYHLRLFEFSYEYEADVSKDVKRLKQSGHLNPYEPTYLRKVKQPYHALRLTRLVLYVQIYYLLIKCSLRFFWHVLSAFSSLFSFLF
uniref:Uncharacterized protein n=1 Tax=Strombidium inclinatum TaxID=197538 RepID=A0A7S3IWB1_9SPIT|mmetsp:Transcript_39328/g.60099  ORF Transcript_39328/g.60099 Transcript_39328/m.60099 type:complete len:136 (+) Transcript_39328:2328-2735(+)